jgi:hypothetical protein
LTPTPQEKAMNIYEDETLEQKLEALSDQAGLLVLDLLLAGLQKARREIQIFQEFSGAKAEARSDRDPF